MQVLQCESDPQTRSDCANNDAVLVSALGGAPYSRAQRCCAVNRYALYLAMERSCVEGEAVRAHGLHCDPACRVIVQQLGLPQLRSSVAQSSAITAAATPADAAVTTPRPSG